MLGASGWPSQGPPGMSTKLLQRRRWSSGRGPDLLGSYAARKERRRRTIGRVSPGPPGRPRGSPEPPSRRPQGLSGSKTARRAGDASRHRGCWLLPICVGEQWRPLRGPWSKNVALRLVGNAEVAVVPDRGGVRCEEVELREDVRHVRCALRTHVAKGRVAVRSSRSEAGCSPGRAAEYRQHVYGARAWVRAVLRRTGNGGAHLHQEGAGHDDVEDAYAYRPACLDLDLAPRRCCRIARFGDGSPQEPVLPELQPPPLSRLQNGGEVLQGRLAGEVGRAHGAARAADVGGGRGDAGDVRDHPDDVGGAHRLLVEHLGAVGNARAYRVCHPGEAADGVGDLYRAALGGRVGAPGVRARRRLVQRIDGVPKARHDV
mmetsp:Transcript_98372/g.264417  ORF Transcript_98372/g.264417 Transcript_98372/m.264417 type:complete len:374 (+) Transcript_98372:177-1298(+)